MILFIGKILVIRKKEFAGLWQTPASYFET